MLKNGFLHTPRNYREIPLWKDVTPEQWNDPKWQNRNAIRTVGQLGQVIRLTDLQREKITEVINILSAQGKDAFRITPYYASLMQEEPFNPVLFGKKDSGRLDPIFWQSVPTPANLLFPDSGKECAMAEGSRSYGAAYQRYPNRVALFVAENTSCASYCNHCQRAKSLDAATHISTPEINKGLFYISRNANINEVLVTGGDALMISKKRLAFVLQKLSAIPHLRVIRLATRVPVVLPMGITDELLTLVKENANYHNSGHEKYVYFMTHINHFHEITAEMQEAVRCIREHGFTVRNQTVLLNHVNNGLRTLAETFRRMFWIGVHPYYLLQCHKEKGILHFIVPIQEGKIFMKNLQGWISGVTVPRYAANIEGGGGKVVLMPSGHDTMHVETFVDDRMVESFANVATWDDRRIENYEALGRTTPDEFREATRVMDEFIGRPGVFLPKLNLFDAAGKFIGTTNRFSLPEYGSKRKSDLLAYDLYGSDMPLTNPAHIEKELDKAFERSEYAKW